MKIILHIGTHKTGTSSLQNYLASNRDVLRAHKIYYPLGTQSGRNVNFLASRLVAGKLSEIAGFLNKSFSYAERNGMNTVLMSAESFYAMTAFFRLMNGGTVDNYWDHEKRCIGGLKELLAGHDVRVVCYLRSQDAFIDSIYNQFVKQAPGYSGTIGSFMRIAPQMTDYYEHLGIWATVFGRDALVVRNFDKLGGLLTDDFVRHALCLESSERFRPPGAQVNERLCNDVLEFKRIVNRIQVPIPEALVMSRILARISASMDCSADSRLVLSDEQIESLMRRHSDGNKRISQEYLKPGENLLVEMRPEVIKHDLQKDGLSAEHAIEILLRMQREMSHPKVRISIAIRRAVRSLLERFPSLETMIGWLRRIVNRRRVRLERQGRA